jgi:5-methylcytosine-specific restriction endonuclease McrA
MKARARHFVFRQVYDMAAIVEASLADPDALLELNWDNPDVRLGIAKSQQISLLHQFIYAVIAIHHRYEYRKNADMYESADIAEIEALLDEYAVPYGRFEDFDPAIDEASATSRAELPFYQWFAAQESSFELLWEKMTDETFHLLFANRSFLLAFNRNLAEYLSANRSLVPCECRTADGRVARQPLPRWARDAVFFRDQGRCVLCHVDLSGLLSTDRVDHFDHMVPLAQWGTNDPCNLQLLCEACNVRKAAGEAVTGHRYAAWWRY